LRTEVLRRLLTREHERALERRVANPWDFDRVVEGPLRVLKDDGEPLLVYIPCGISEESARVAYEFLHSIRNKVTRNRSMYGSSKRTKHVRKDGRVSRTLNSEPVRSVILGSFDRYPRTPYCRASAISLLNKRGWESCFGMIREAADLLREHVPVRFQNQSLQASLTDRSYVIPGTPFTTVTVNNTVAGGYHKDSGDLASGFGVLSALRRGFYQGGLLVFPAFRVAVDLRDRDVLLADVHELHGNTPIRGAGPATLPEKGGHERISVVYYFRERMVDCLPPEEEIKRARMKREIVKADGL
jgi:hypothetical protein